LYPDFDWHTSMNLWLNSLIFYIQIFLFKDGQNFNPFSCSIFPFFQWLSELEPKTALSDSITWVFVSRFGRGIPFWICGWILLYSTFKSYFLTRVKILARFHIRFLRISNGFQNRNPNLGYINADSLIFYIKIFFLTRDKIVTHFLFIFSN